LKNGERDLLKCICGRRSWWNYPRILIREDIHMDSRKSIPVEEVKQPTADMDSYWWELILGILLMTGMKFIFVIGAIMFFLAWLF
jgi:hypothetical protein